MAPHGESASANRGRVWLDIPGQELLELGGAAGERLLVKIARGPGPPPLPPAAQRLWERRCTANPRLHDGPILTVTAINQARGHIECLPDRFQRLASEGEGVDLGVRLLGVKGMVVGRDRTGVEHVLIARRGRQTRVYGDMWEIAPAGGIDVPKAGVTRLEERDIVAALVHEGQEELGMPLDPTTARPVAIVRDEVSHAADIVVRVDWKSVVDPKRAVCAAGGCSWEYSDSAWLARPDAAAFDQRSAGSIVGPMRAVLRWLGWT